MTEAIRSVRYTTTRFTIDTGETPDAFRARYEQAVPPLPREQVAELAHRQAPWSQMLDLIASAAPLGFLIYFRNDSDPIFPLAGDTAVCTSYLMGNHTIAERMYRYEPSILLYAPLHTAVWGEPEGTGYFTFEQPSDLFGSYDHPEISEVGRELDQKLAALLNHLGLPVPPELSAV